VEFFSKRESLAFLFDFISFISPICHSRVKSKQTKVTRTFVYCFHIC